jgi:adenylate cyclase, class 2
MSSGGRETEIKLPVASADEALRKLNAAGFQVSKPRALEKNTAYDTPQAELRRSSRLLRLREFGQDYTVTYKGPPTVDKHKSREEIETEVSSPEALRAIFERLGYAPSFRYEKFRTEFNSAEQGTATLDETPIGVYMELEGEPEWIDRMARKLGYEEKDYITASYARLFQDWRERTGSAARDMLFQIFGDERAGN